MRVYMNVNGCIRRLSYILARQAHYRRLILCLVLRVDLGEAGTHSNPRLSRLAGNNEFILYLRFVLLIAHSNRKHYLLPSHSPPPHLTSNQKHQHEKLIIRTY